jgi:hypothetical protein
MTPNEWIALVTAALRGPVGQLREDPAKLVTVIDYLERIADQAPILPKTTEPPQVASRAGSCASLVEGHRSMSRKHDV